MFMTIVSSVVSTRIMILERLVSEIRDNVSSHSVIPYDTAIR